MRARSLSENIVLATQRILEVYDGDCRNIWEGKKDIGEVTRKFREFRGVGQKISNASAYGLLRNHGVRFKGLEKLDVPADRHVIRVFMRTGLVGARARLLCYITYSNTKKLLLVTMNFCQHYYTTVSQYETLASHYEHLSATISPQ